MPIKKLTLGICLLIAGQALAQTRTHTVRSGDTISAIASRYHTTWNAIVRANNLKERDQLKLGQKLRLPGATVVTKSSPSTSKGGYVVRSGDNDWIIAHKLGISTPALHKLNPAVRWVSLKPGQQLNVPKAVLAEVSVPRLRSHYAIVSKDNVIVRRTPSRNSDQIVQVPQGTKVAVLDRQGDWYMLKFPRGTEGWVRGDMLTASTAPHTVATRHHRTYTSRHTQASTRAAQRSRQGGMTLASDPVVSKSLIDTAKTYRGVRYVWGGMSRSGTDCSGFTSQVYGSRGVRLPRTSREQARVGQPVRGSSLTKGDLVFFKTTRANRISHVGIYVGNGKFIHASSGSGHVQVSSLSEGYYHSRFATARRVVPPTSKAKSSPKKAEPKPRSEPRAEPEQSTEPKSDGLSDAIAR